jgi:DNA-binding response OmpR family regulator
MAESISARKRSKAVLTEENPLPLPPLAGPDGRPHIYVINSSSEFLELIQEVLSDIRLHVTLEQMRSNPEVTIGNLRSAQPDLLMLDVVPYTNDAVQILERMNHESDLDHLPVMLVSTNQHTAEQLAEAYAPLVREVLPKPFDIDELYAKLSQLVANIQVP